MPKKQLTGFVVSDKMAKTIVVETERIKEHPKYRQRFRIHKRYKAHDQNKLAKVGDKVLIEECRPFSKEKTWKLLRILESKDQSVVEEPALKEELTEKEEK